MVKFFVVDASVAVKWYVPETLSERAVNLLRQVKTNDLRLYAPDLILTEIGNVIWKKLRRGELELEIATEIIEAISNFFPVRLVRSTSMLIKAFTIAKVWQRTVYDSLYLALAQTGKAKFITADERLVNALASTELADCIYFLGALP